MKKNYNRKGVFLFIFSLIWISFPQNGYSQITISTPTINFSQACASSSFNNYNFSFSFSPIQNLGAGNQFIVELSDAVGSFASPTIVQTLTNTTSPVTGSFSLPTTTSGSAYRIRIRSTNPVKISNPSNAFAAHYAIHNTPFSINGNVGTVNLCGEDSYILQIDNLGTPASPTYYPFLIYKWYKNFIPIPGETGSSIEVTTPGSYYVIVDYGACVMNSYSNIVQIQVAPEITPEIEAQDGSLVICPNSSTTLTSVLQNSNYIYTWHKNNAALPNSNSPTFNATEEGVYHLVITNQGCPFESNSLVLEVTDFDLSLSETSEVILIPGETIVISSTTDAVNPTYQWFRDNIAINGATQSSLSVTQDGVYKLEASQASPCAIVKEESVTVVYPLDFDLSIALPTGYQNCVSQNTSLSIDGFDALTTNNIISILGNSYNYSYQWLKNGVAVSGATATTLAIASALQNGNYSLQVTIPDFGIITSNVIPVNLAPPAVTISNATLLCEGSDVLLTSSITDSGYTYQWFKNGSALPGATASTLTVSEEGGYYIEIAIGSCSSQSNTIQLDYQEFNIFTSTPDFDILLPGESKTLAITTDAVLPVYSWYKDNVLINGQTQNTLTVSQPGTYKVIVTQNQGCVATAEKIFILEYPTGFGLNISIASDYASCVSNETSLSVSNFSAFTTIGTIDLTGQPNSYSYQWLLNGNPIPGATSSTLNVSTATQNGNYSLSISIPDFAPVVSNIVAINLKPETPAITNQSALCEGSTVVLTSSVTSPEYDYQWYFNSVAIPGAGSSSVTVSEEGSYYLVLSSGPCESISNTIDLEFATINISSTSPDFDILLPGESKTFVVSTDAVLPVYSWYKDNVLINGQTQNTLTVSQPGTYKVIVTQDQGCIATAEKIFILEYPTGFGLEIGPVSDYASCVSNVTSISVSNFGAFTTIGTIDLTGLPNSYSYQWLLNGNPIAGATSNILNINSATQNGNYSLSISVPDFALVISNTVVIHLKPETPAITNQGILCEGSTVLLTSNVTNPEYGYQWYFNSAAIPGANSSSVTVSEEGSYYLAITSGSCESISNTIDLEFATINISSASPDHDVILPGETKTLVVSTDAVLPVYSWYKDDVLINGETQNTLTVDQPGTYKAVIVQNQGCVAIVEKIFILEAPTGFLLEIDINSDYNQCTSETITLAITNFIAYTTLGSITITDVQNAAYSYQWFKDEQPVSGATASSITLNDESQNGNYELQVSVSGFAPIVSNIETVDLIFSEPLSLTVAGNLCNSSNPAIITANIVNPSYTYIWYKEGIAIATNNSSSYSTTETGNYYVVVNTGSCIFSSNTVAVEEADFALTSTNPDLDVIIPGEVKTLSITTDALQPTIVWYRNNVQISNSNSSSFSVNLDGEYKVIVTQTQDCVVAKEKIFEMEYPSQFDLVIDHAGNYQECGSTATELEVIDFTATTLNGLVDLSSNPYNYTYQWLKNNQPIPGATSPTLTLDEIADNGTYTLNVYVTNILILSSNPKEVTLGFVDSVTISTADVYCNSGTPITITSDVNNPEYTYEWYKSGDTAVIGNNSSITVTETGSYYLVVSYLSCTVTSNVLEILPFDIEQLVVDADSEILLPEGTEITITASGAQNYAWYLEGTLLSQTPSLSITEPGHYTLIASVGGCEATRHFYVTLKPNNILAIPNVVTPNGDGINDTWAIPLKYVNDPNVEIVIYGPDGTIVFRASSYMNNWPESDFTYSKKNPVYYYTIMENYKITKRGSITIIK